jgi:uncharacterized membrane protein
MDGDTWLGQVIDNIPASEIDGFAIHAYGGTVTDFETSYRATLAKIDSKGLKDRGVYMTEWCRATDPNVPTGESVTSQFCRDAFASVNSWNRTDGKHNIVSMSWFIYDADNQSGGSWNSMALEYWKTHGYGAGDSRDLYTAFQETVDLHYAAGFVGTRGVVASFTGTPLRGRAPLQVQFMDQSTGTVQSWAWSFGDGGTSVARNPIHTYAQQGDYTVILSIEGNGSNSLTRTGYISVVPQPGDFDDDLDVDQEDFGKMQGCLTGSNNVQPDPACRRARMDADADVDADDLVLFARCFGEPGVPAEFGCAP